MSDDAEDMIAAYLGWLTIRSKSDYTTGGWGRVLRLAQRQLPHGLDEASEAEIVAWLGRPKLSPATRFSYFTALNLFYRWATRASDQWLELNPMAEIPAPRMPAGIPNPCSDEELTHILTHARDDVRLWATLAAYAGLRCLEIGRLTTGDVTADYLAVHGKGDKRATIPTHPVVWQAIQQLPPGPVARGRDGRQLNGVQVSHISRRVLQHDLGMPGMGLHRLRHWLLTRIQEEHGDLRLTQEIARHASPATTARYTMVADKRRTAAIRAMPVLGAASCVAMPEPVAALPPPPPG